MDIKKDKSSGAGSIHRILAVRLLITGSIVSIVLGLAVILIERNKVGEVVLDRALQSAIHFNVQVDYLLDIPGLPDREGIQHELESFISQNKKTSKSYHSTMSHFVFTRIFEPDSKMVAKYVDDNYADIASVRTYMESTDLWFPRDNEDWFEVVRINTAPYVKVNVPLNNSSGEVVAYAEGVSAVSTDAITAVRRRAIRVAIAVIAIVLITTALIYPIVIKLMSKSTRLSLELLDSQLETLKVLGSAIAMRDNDTDAHNYRVTIFSVYLAEAADLSQKSIQTLIKGAFLHDVGKIGITDNILLKPGNLTEREFNIMKNHVTQGLNIIEQSEWLEDASDVVGLHHEQVDGNGYPKGFRTEKIPVTARIFSIADVFDALSSKRPYKEPFSFEETMKIIEGKRGSHFDSKLVDTFTNIARSLFDRFAGSKGDELKDEVDTIIQKYFPRDINIIFD